MVAFVWQKTPESKTPICQQKQIEFDKKRKFLKYLSRKYFSNNHKSIMIRI
jgi:hypothetical protein